MSEPAANILPIPLADALGERYLSYALSTIMARSLPDVRDGLKPVHRRLLWAMRQLRLDPRSAPKKSARVVGDVIGRFHPHGDAAVYDALVRLAQDFAVRYPLIDGQGNFGNIDGDNAAAMRYTEARLTEVAEALMEGLDEDAVDTRPTYDDDGEEPVVFPAGFPNLLANGAQGIAVGMATSIPPHNVHEVCEALLHLIAHPDATTAALTSFIRAPDFPTGGELVEPAEAIVEAYETGRGSFRLRARWQVEKLPQGLYQIVVTEIPYQVAKSRLVERIAQLVMDRKLPILADVRDESTEAVRLVLEPRSRNVEAAVLMEQLFRQTDLEVKVQLNLNVLDSDGVPRVMTLKEVLGAFLAHRHEVLVRRSNHRLEKIALRLEVLEGYLVAYLNIDEVIAIIRQADDPKAEMMRRFRLSDAQVEAILNMRLRALRRLEEIEIRREHDGLSAEQGSLRALLADQGLRWEKIAGEIGTVIERFGRATDLGRRRTRLGEAPAATVVPLEALVEREPVTIYLSDKGWIRAVRGHQAASAEVKYKEGDEERFVVHAFTTDRLVLFASDGRFYTLAADKLPRGRGFGEPVRLMVDLGNEAGLVALFAHDPARRLIVAASDGRGFLVSEEGVAAQTRAGRQVLNVTPPAVAVACAPVPEGADTVAVIGSNRKLLCFPLDQVPELARGRGVRLQKYKDGRLEDVVAFRRDEGLAWGRRIMAGEDLAACLGTRAQAGRLAPKGYPKTTRFS